MATPETLTRFERLRMKAGLTITQVSIEALISRSTVEKIEKDIPITGSARFAGL